jgi:hypothetical protein
MASAILLKELNCYRKQLNAFVLVGATDSQFPSRQGKGIGMVIWSNGMKQSFSLALIAAFILIMPCVAQAGVLENMDLDDYQYETYGPGGIPLSSGTIYAESVQSDFCVEGCQLKLLKTGQTMFMQPDDHIVISDGVMKRKEE